MEQALKPPVVLDWYLGYLSCWLRNLGVPGWSDAVLTDTLRYDETHGLPCAMDSLFTVETYRERFTVLCTSGWPWIGLHAVGLLDEHNDLHVSASRRSKWLLIALFSAYACHIWPLPLASRRRCA